jgi:hypothetical protein
MRAILTGLLNMLGHIVTILLQIVQHHLWDLLLLFLSPIMFLYYEFSCFMNVTYSNLSMWSFLLIVIIYYMSLYSAKQIAYIIRTFFEVLKTIY